MPFIERSEINSVVHSKSLTALVPIVCVLHFHALQLGPSFSCPAFSAPPFSHGLVENHGLSLLFCTSDTFRRLLNSRLFSEL